MIKSYEDLFAFGKDNVDAAIKSSTLAAKGFEQLAKQYLDFAVASAGQASNGWKELSACTSPVQFAEVQSRLAREATESLVAEGRRMAEMTTTVVSASLEPLSARVQQVMKTAA